MGGGFTVIAGPCAVESRESILTIAKSVSADGAAILRGGAFKLRSSPYDFQGLGAEGIELMLTAKKQTGMAIVSEITDSTHLPLYDEVDIIQVGARNMQNTELLKELGKLRKPILLKRGAGNTIEELLLSAEHIMAGGNLEVILCERGIRTFEPLTRFTLDLAAVPILKSLTHLPIVVDPSHAVGTARFVPQLAMAAAAAGAHGLMVEVHDHPATAMCDGGQSLSLMQFGDMMRKLRQLVASTVETTVEATSTSKEQTEVSSLSDLRKQIDEIDVALAGFLRKRYDVVTTIATLKQEQGLPIHDPIREAEILAKLMSGDKEQDDYVKAVFAAIIEKSRGLHTDFCRVDCGSSPQ
jgi:3-deoxy-7-phosphoheptulonate synthase